MDKKVKAVGTILEYNGQLLLLYRSKDGPHGCLWGLPAGKVNEGESELDAAVREVFEETGYQSTRSDLELIGRFDWEFPEFIVDFYLFKLRLGSPINVTLFSEEHTEYTWITPVEAYSMNDLIVGLHQILEHAYEL